MARSASERLSALLLHSYHRVPFYADKIYLDVAMAKEIRKSLSSLPLLSKASVRRAGLQLLASGSDQSAWRRSRTTGTTGEPLEVILDAAAVDAEAIAFGACVDRWIASDEWRRRSVFHLTLHPQSRSVAMTAPWDPAGFIVKWSLARVWAQKDEVFRNRLAPAHAAVLTMFPSVATLIAARLLIRPKEYVPRPSLIVLSGEMVHPDARAIISAAFQCPVKALYTMSEVGIIAAETGKSGTYQTDETSVIVEIVDDEGLPVRGSLEGEIVVTPLDNYAMPLIRYRTGDRGLWIGRNNRYFSISCGRSRHYLTASDGTSVSTARFAKTLAILNVEAIDLVQNPDGSILLRYQAPTVLDPIGWEALHGVLSTTLGPHISIVTERVKRLTPRPEKGRYARPVLDTRNTEPTQINIGQIATWLHRELSELEGVVAAVLTGSALDPRQTSRYSDVDLAV